MGWEWQYSIQFSGLCHTMALPPFSDGIILWQANTIYCYDLATSELRIFTPFAWADQRLFSSVFLSQQISEQAHYANCVA
jgi:hypothetical protein